MLNVRILDCDGSVVSQPFAADLLRAGEATVVDVRDLATRLRIVASRSALAKLRQRLDVLHSINLEVFFLGSGDFHHLIFPLLERLTEEVVLVHFDNHPDWVRYPSTVNCGSWVNHALKLEQVKKVVTIGPCSDDLKKPQLKFANLSAIRAGDLEIYAWDAKPVRIFGAAIDGPGVRTRGSKLCWRNLSAEPWEGFVTELCQRLSGTSIWVTFDKDVLEIEDAVTNWDQGKMKLWQVLYAVEQLSLGSRIVGIDICGDYSLPRFSDPFRQFLSWIDRANPNVDPKAAVQVNDMTNRKIISFLNILCS